MRWLLLAPVVLAGCTTTVVRQSTVDPATALRLGQRADVIAVNSVAVPHGVVVSDGGADMGVVTSDQKLHLESSDAVTVRMVYRNGDLIPGEGEVHTRVSSSLIIGGVGMLLGGVAGAMITAWEASLFTQDLSNSPSATAFFVANCVIAAGGIVMIVFGATPRPHVEPWVVPSAFVAPGGGGGTLLVRF